MGERAWARALWGVIGALLLWGAVPTVAAAFAADTAFAKGTTVLGLQACRVFRILSDTR
jgi:hypothetical protein